MRRCTVEIAAAHGEKSALAHRSRRLIDLGDESACLSFERLSLEFRIPVFEFILSGEPKFVTSAFGRPPFATDHTLERTCSSMPLIFVSLEKRWLNAPLGSMSVDLAKTMRKRAVALGLGGRCDRQSFKHRSSWGEKRREPDAITNAVTRARVKGSELLISQSSQGPTP